MGKRDLGHEPGASICTFATDTAKVIDGHVCSISSVAQSQRVRDTQGYTPGKPHLIFLPLSLSPPIVPPLRKYQMPSHSRPPHCRTQWKHIRYHLTWPLGSIQYSWSFLFLDTCSSSALRDSSLYVHLVFSWTFLIFLTSMCWNFQGFSFWLIFFYTHWFPKGSYLILCFEISF